MISVRHRDKNMACIRSRDMVRGVDYIMLLALVQSLPFSRLSCEQCAKGSYANGNVIIPEPSPPPSLKSESGVTTRTDPPHPLSWTKPNPNPNVTPI